jgi:hypothetical protein
MKKYAFLFFTVATLVSCSTPKYTYYFDHYNYAKKDLTPEAIVTVQEPIQESPLILNENTLVASVNEKVVYVAEPTPTIAKEEAIAKISSMSRDEQKELKKGVKRFVKENKKEIKNGNTAKALESDVKLAAIFGAVGIVLLIIGGDVLYILGAVALIVGLYFFIRLLIRQ